MSLVLQARRFPARLPLPDLSRWLADRELITGEEEPRKAIPEPEVWTPNISISGGVKTATAADKATARGGMDF
jgi:type IV secretion system protein VirD4